MQRKGTVYARSRAAAEVMTNQLSLFPSSLLCKCNQLLKQPSPPSVQPRGAFAAEQPLAAQGVGWREIWILWSQHVVAGTLLALVTRKTSWRPGHTERKWAGRSRRTALQQALPFPCICTCTFYRRVLHHFNSKGRMDKHSKVTQI